MANTVSGIGEVTGTFGAILLIAITYMAGRWQFNKAGATIDNIFKNYAQEVAGISAIAAGLFGKEMVPDSVLPDILVFIGSLQIVMDLLSNEEVKAVFGSPESAASSMAAGGE